MVDNNESLDNILYLKGIILTDEQRSNLNKIVEDMSIFCNSLQEIIDSMFQDRIVPALKEIKKFIDEKYILKQKFDVIKNIKYNSYIRLNKPKFICCRSNC